MHRGISDQECGADTFRRFALAVSRREALEWLEKCPELGHPGAPGAFRPSPCRLTALGSGHCVLLALFQHPGRCLGA